MLWLALLGEEIALLHHLPKMDDNLHACPEELAEAAFLHLGRPDDAGRPVLDAPGGTKKYIVQISGTYVVNLVVARVVIVVAQDDKVATFLLFRSPVVVGIDVVCGGYRSGGRGGSGGVIEDCHFRVCGVCCVLCVACLPRYLVWGESVLFISTVREFLTGMDLFYQWAELFAYVDWYRT